MKSKLNRIASKLESKKLTEKESVLVTVRLSKDIYKKLSVVSKQKEIPLSTFIREILKEYTN